MTNTDNIALKTRARTAGFLFLVWIITGLFGLMYIPAKINMRGDAADTARNILANEFLFRTGVVVDLAGAAIWILLVLAFYRLFRQVHEFQAKLLVAFVLVQIPVVFMTDACNMVALMLFKGDLMKALDLAQRQELAAVFLKVNTSVTLVLEFFWGLWLLPLALLTYRSGFLPRFLGIWLFANGFAYLIVCLTGILFPLYSDTVYQIAFPVFFGEMALMLWLVIRGAKDNGAQMKKHEYEN
ncbi:MAG: DUF4386 domain-containing protein [Thermoanaerobaculia bacterium]|nr:DUF4386 domain-containing protein [Thermoanaerobaculia bacterium]